MDCSYNVACKSGSSDVVVTQCAKFDPWGTGEKLWTDLRENGKLTEQSVEETLKSKDVAVAVCAQVTVPGQASAELEFTLNWDMPLVQFYNKTQTYSRYYTKYFGSSGEAGLKMADYALNNYPRWEQAIDNWQRPILEDR